eukprot:15483177-Alexandrium_andersonii.AAC.1
MTLRSRKTSDRDLQRSRSPRRPRPPGPDKPSNAPAQPQRRSEKLPHPTCLAPRRCRAPISAASCA